MTSLLRYNGALVLWSEAWYQLGGEPADLLRIYITNFLRHVHYRCYHLVMTLLTTLLIITACPTHLYRQLITGGVSNKLAWLFLHILCSTVRLIDCTAFRRSLPIAGLFKRGVAFTHCLIVCPLLERDATIFLKIFITYFLF